MGGEAATILLDLIVDRRAEPRQVLITPELIVLGSTAAPPVREGLGVS